MYRKTEDPQTVDSPRADSEWKADPAIGELSHGRDGPVSLSLPSLHSPPTFPESPRREPLKTNESQMQIQRRRKSTARTKQRRLRMWTFPRKAL